MLTLTWRHCSPAETPVSPCITVIGAEYELDGVGYACDGVWQGGAAGLLHQGCPVAVRDCQVVVAAGGTRGKTGSALNVKSSEL